jgi:hypothetical protein
MLLVTEEKGYPTGDDYKRVYTVPSDYSDTVEGAMSRCRAWYDFNAYGAKYCC